MDFLTTLVEKGLIQEADVPAIKKEVNSGKGLENVLVARGVSPEEILEAKGAYYGVPTRSLGREQVPLDVIKFIPEKTVGQYKVFPLGETDGVLEVGFVNPDNLQARDAVQFIASKNNTPFKIYAILESDFEEIRSSYGGLSGEVNKALSELESELSEEEKKMSDSISEIESEEKEEGNGQMKTQIIEDAPVTKIVATILRYATEGRASDIHIEPLDERVRVRFRVDGTMHTRLILPKNVHNAVVARTKILSNMKLDEKRKPQDGRFSAHIEGRKIDFRVSTFPTYYGEKVVMRILDSAKGVIKLDEMEMTKRNLSLVRDAIKQPYGLILISGPTGSGKTTTLYSMVNELDRKTKNVLSLEDPVEYHIEGMNQSQIHPEIGYTFANGLRTTLRQDPDIIMVGEIRDEETAGLAIQAALTGHLVLSTIHTNTAAGVIPRLVDMGVDPYLIAPTLILAIAQRLVKTLCPDAGEPVPVEGSIEKIIENEMSSLPENIRTQIDVPDTVYKARPTDDCPSGTRGRMAVFEMFEMDKDLEQVLLSDPNEATVFGVAQKKGMLTLKQDALLKAFSGKIPFEEVNKV
ncbi:MAG: ATPase, T2SS/T4P/T4SS family [Candidatus Paceibacterota bacterium]